MFHHKALVSILDFAVNTVDNEVIHQAGIPLKGTLTMTDYEISVHWAGYQLVSRCARACVVLASW